MLFGPPTALHFRWIFYPLLIAVARPIEADMSQTCDTCHYFDHGNDQHGGGTGQRVGVELVPIQGTNQLKCPNCGKVYEKVDAPSI